MAIAIPETGTTPTRARGGRTWSPHVWEGCSFRAWILLLSRNSFRVGWRYWWVAAIVTIVSIFHSFLYMTQRVFFGRRIRRTVIDPHPVFILGHWRTGTTLLHELLSLDPRHAFPTSYQCFAPNHFLLTEKLITTCLWFLTPTKRQMDNMAAGWDRPQEDEFAMCMLGQPSLYLTIAFPNHGPANVEYLDLEGLKPRALDQWKRCFKRFLQTVAYRNPKRLVLKSPTHTCRIKVLKEMFPNAIFIHIVRNPYRVFPSTMNLWKALYQRHGLQKPTFEGLEDDVFETYVHMYDKLEQTRHLVDQDHFYELRYEDLVRDPVHEMRALYEHLNLGAFDKVLPRLEDYLASVAGYETNHYELTPKLRAEIKRRWGRVIEQYGYGEDSK
jgi:omega-hydroxy-beta-dihydromenaquinone-9 sulfotransferase